MAEITIDGVIYDIPDDSIVRLAELIAKSEKQQFESSPYPSDYEGFMSEHADQRGAVDLGDNLDVIAMTPHDFITFVKERDRSYPGNHQGHPDANYKRRMGKGIDPFSEVDMTNMSLETLDAAGDAPDQSLIGLSIRHTGNGEVYTITGFAWDGATDTWRILHTRDGCEVVFSRSFRNMFGERDNGEIRFVPVIT